MTEITRRGVTPGQSIAPAATAPGAPTITPAGITRAQILPSSDPSRETDLERKFATIQAEADRTGWMRGRDYGVSERPATPVSDAFITVIRARDEPAGSSLEENIIQDEQRQYETWLATESARAELLPLQIKREKDEYALRTGIDAMAQRESAGILQRREEDRERQRIAEEYGYQSYADLEFAIYEEKVTRTQNELGSALADVGLITAAVSRDGYAELFRETGEDPEVSLRRAAARARSAEATLDQYGADLPGNNYLEQAEAFTFRERQRWIAQEGLENFLRDADAAPAGRMPNVPEWFDTSVARAGYSEESAQGLLNWATDYQAFIDRAESPQTPERSDLPLYSASVKAGLLTSSIVGGTEMIQAAGERWLGDLETSALRGVDRTFQDNPQARRDFTNVVNLGIGALRAPFAIQGAALTIPALEYAAREPGAFAAALGPGAAKYASDLFTSAQEKPWQFIGEMATSAILGYYGSKALDRALRPVSSRMTEFIIKRRASAIDRPAIGAISTIGRNVPKMRSTIEVDPDLSKILNIGEKAPIVEDVLRKQPHTIYGSATQIGQMPAERLPATPKDLDVFVSDVEAFNKDLAGRLGPDYTIDGTLIRKQVGADLTAHAVDTHPFPENYPIKPSGKRARVIYEEAEMAQDLPFDFMPDEVLKGDRLTQEFLYTQVLRKATSVMGEKEGAFSWRFGPQAHRLKDIPTLIADTEWLIESQKQILPEMGRIGRFTTEYKIRRVESALNVLKQNPLVQEALPLTISPVAVPEGIITITYGSRSRPPKIPRAVTVPDALSSPSPAGSSPSPGTIGSPSIDLTGSPRIRSTPPSKPKGRTSDGISPIITVDTSPFPSSPPSKPRRDVSPIITPAPSPSPVLTGPSNPTRPSPSPRITTTIPSTVPSTPNYRIPFTPTTTPIKPIIEVDDKSRGPFASDFYINYADQAAPVAQLERAFTDLDDPAPRPIRVESNFMRQTLGDVRLLDEPRPVTIDTFKVKRPKRQKLPWGIDIDPEDLLL